MPGCRAARSSPSAANLRRSYLRSPLRIVVTKGHPPKTSCHLSTVEPMIRGEGPYGPAPHGTYSRDKTEFTTTLLAYVHTGSGCFPPAAAADQRQIGRAHV